MIRVYADMVGDLFHYGHVEFLEKARALGDYLIVGVHGDNDAEINKRKPILTMEERVACVVGCRYADEVLPNAPWIIDRAWIDLHKIDLVAHGDDYTPEKFAYIFKAPIEMGIFCTVSYSPAISTTEIIRRIKEERI